MTCGCEAAVAWTIGRQLGDDTAVEANAGKDEVRVAESADRQLRH